MKQLHNLSGRFQNLEPALPAGAHTSPLPLSALFFLFGRCDSLLLNSYQMSHVSWMGWHSKSALIDAIRPKALELLQQVLTHSLNRWLVGMAAWQLHRRRLERQIISVPFVFFSNSTQTSSTCLCLEREKCTTWRKPSEVQSLNFFGNIEVAFQMNVTIKGRVWHIDKMKFIQQNTACEDKFSHDRCSAQKRLDILWLCQAGSNCSPLNRWVFRTKSSHIWTYWKLQLY